MRMFRKNCKLYWNLKTAMCQQKSQSPAHLKGFLLTLRRMFQESLNVFEWFLQLNIFGNGYDPPLEFLKYYLFLHFGPIMLLEVHIPFLSCRYLKEAFSRGCKTPPCPEDIIFHPWGNTVVTSALASCRHAVSIFSY